ncbi:MAG: site-specific integrase [Prevotella sp.]|nr:site-specific integrase [Prevotella sp.]
MATLSVEIGKPKKDGQMKVNVMLCHASKRKRIPTNIFLEPGDLTRSGNISNKRKRHLIDDLLDTYRDRIYEAELELTGRKVTVDELANMIIGKEKKEHDFFTFADDWISKSKLKWLPNYNCALNALEKHLGRRTLAFSEITYDLLDGFCKSLDGLQRAPSMYIRIIKQLIKEARLRYNTDTNIAIPFTTADNFKTPKEVTAKKERSIDLATLRKIIAYTGTGRAGLARDCYILSFCMMGINSVDLYSCTTIKGDTITYNRSKTKTRRDDEAYIEVDVHDYLKPLMKKYKGRTRIFDFYTRYANFQNFNSNLNKGLKTMCEDLGIEKITFYSARHTWASIARNELHIDKYTIHEALNHIVDDMAITDRYIKRDFTLINEANKKVIDFVLGNEKGGAE